MSTTLYPGIAFSPQAVLTDNIGAADTIIPVSDVSAFPDAPNLATIGTDEEGETVLYTAKTTSALSGCQRGVEGAAKSWQAGELIGRNFTAKDHADLIAAVGTALSAASSAQSAAETVGTTMGEAINELNASKQSKLTGSAGQVVGFGADGAAVAQDGWSNINMAPNWYFPDPVNQRGQASYTVSATTKIAVGSCIDRFKIDANVGSSITCELDDGGILLTAVPPENGFGQMNFYTTFPGYAFSPGVYTISWLYSSDCKVRPYVYSSKAGVVPGWKDFPVSSALNVAEIQFEVTEEAYIGNIRANLQINTASTVHVKLVAAKVESGNQSTIARQDAFGNWTLNDPPPNKALELMKCQRYFTRLIPYSDGWLGKIGTFYPTSERSGAINITIPAVMRIKPAITISSLLLPLRGNGSSIIYTAPSDTTFSPGNMSGNLISINISSPTSLNFPSAIEQYQVYDLLLQPGTYIDFNAEVN